MFHFTTPQAVANLARCAMRTTVLELDNGYSLWHGHDDDAQRRTLWNVYRDSELLASRHSLFQAITEAISE